jgi:hypothetical protein
MPNFMDFEPEPPVDFDTLDELRAVPFVKRWADDPQCAGLASGGPHGDEHLLMALMRDGSHWVIGYMQQPVELPHYKINKQAPGGTS